MNQCIPLLRGTDRNTKYDNEISDKVSDQSARGQSHGQLGADPGVELGQEWGLMREEDVEKEALQKVYATLFGGEDTRGDFPPKDKGRESEVAVRSVRRYKLVVL